MKYMSADRRSGSSEGVANTTKADKNGTIEAMDLVRGLAGIEKADGYGPLLSPEQAHAIATAIMLFFALCGAWILGYLNISEAAFRIAGGIILFLVALDMLAAKRQQRKREATTGDDSAAEPDNVAIYPLAIPLLAGPSAIMSVIVVTGGFAGGGLSAVLTGYAALLAVMVATGLILSLTVLAEGWMNEKITMVFSRITAIILAGLSVQYVIDGLATISIVNPSG